MGSSPQIDLTKTEQIETTPRCEWILLGIVDNSYLIVPSKRISCHKSAIHGNAKHISKSYEIQKKWQASCYPLIQKEQIVVGAAIFK